MISWTYIKQLPHNPSPFIIGTSGIKTAGFPTNDRTIQQIVEWLRYIEPELEAPINA